MTENNTKRKDVVASITKWIAVISAIITVVLTVIDAYSSNEIAKMEASLRQRQYDLSVEKERVVGHAFVRELFGGILSTKEDQHER